MVDVLNYSTYRPTSIDQRVTTDKHQTVRIFSGQSECLQRTKILVTEDQSDNERVVISIHLFEKRARAKTTSSMSCGLCLSKCRFPQCICINKVGDNSSV